MASWRPSSFLLPSGGYPMTRWYWLARYFWRMASSWMGIAKHNKHSAPQCDLSKLVKGGSPPLLPNYGMFRGAYETIASTLHLHMIPNCGMLCRTYGIIAMVYFTTKCLWLQKCCTLIIKSEPLTPTAMMRCYMANYCLPHLWLSLEYGWNL